MWHISQKMCIDHKIPKHIEVFYANNAIRVLAGWKSFVM
jgi:hypothetical protein